MTKPVRQNCAPAGSKRLPLKVAIPIVAEIVTNIAEGGGTRREASLSTYAANLLDRLNGFSAEPAILALWRDFAWDPQRAPLRNFKLKTADILTAEQRLLAIL